MYQADGSYKFYKTGFLAVQQALSQVHIKHKCKEFNKTQGDITFPPIKDLPSPPIFMTSHSRTLQGVAGMIIIIIFIFVVIRLTTSIVEEKELQLKVTLNLMGVGSCLQWAAWYIETFIIFLIGSSIITLFWKLVPPNSEISFMPFTHWSMALFVLLVLSHCAICFSFLMSSLISRTYRISLVTFLILIATLIPFWACIPTIEKYEFSGRLTFQIFEVDTTWSRIFEFVEGHRSSWQLDDYSLSQPSLEDAFEEIAEEKRKKRERESN
ncbi:GM19382 [Drosophila sechellia]|uniref:GM19382 n=1 Tax=Drosophila sechellia TaxID=7238 RepID=B4HKW7_DROSE|nr:GM19382 [Drosophila sechellia]